MQKYMDGQCGKKSLSEIVKCIEVGEQGIKEL